jgi:hypothetical protein
MEGFMKALSIFLLVLLISEVSKATPFEMSDFERIPSAE